MKFGKLAGLFLALGLGASVAHAQFGVYGEYSATRLGPILCMAPNYDCSAQNSETPPATYSQYDHLNTTGGWGGIYYNWKSFGPVLFGVDLRGGENHSNKSAVSYAGGRNASSSQGALGGIRASFHTPWRVVKPYAQFSLGWERSDVSEPFGTTETGTSSPIPPRQFDNFLHIEGFIGADWRLLPIMDLRIPELGYGNMSRMGSGQGTSSFGVESVSVGVVFHMPH